MVDDAAVSLDASDTMPMGVADIGFMLERLGQDCDDLQFLRELTENSLQASATRIIWDVDWTTWEASGGEQYKLCCIDDGNGMNGPEMIKYINNLSSSTHQQALDGNFGVGAKVAAATRNPAGLIYQSWKDGEGAMVQLWRDPTTRQYGLLQFERPDGSWDYWLPLSPKAKPDEIAHDGTKVVLLGYNEEHNTIEPPPGITVPIPSRWINRYLNARYFRFPEGVEVKVREGWSADPGTAKKNLLRTVRGQGRFLDQHHTAHGVQELAECRVHWWILDESDSRRQASELVNVGHFATLYQDELYELKTSRAGMVRLQQFGIIFGYDRVVLYAEPRLDKGSRLTANTARTQLLRDSRPLPYADWAAEFRANIPQELREYMDAIIAGASGEDHQDQISERLRNYQKLFKLSRYRVKPGGPLSIADPVLPRAKQRTEAIDEVVERTTTPRERTKRDPTGRLLAAMLADDGVDGEEAATVKQDLPSVKWVSVADSTRAPGFLDDRAAKYLPEQNMLQINADFRVFTDMADYWCDEYEVERGNTMVVDVVHEWFGQALVETVLGCQALQGEKRWSPTDIEMTLSEEALTAAVMQRYHVANSVKRTLGTRMGSLRGKATKAA